MADVELFSRNYLLAQEYEADASAPGGVVIFTAAYIDIRNYDRIVAIVLNCTGAQAFSGMTVRGASSAAGANALTICTLTNPANVNLANEWAMIEVRMAYLQQVYWTTQAVELSHLNIGIVTIAGATPVVGTLIAFNGRRRYATLAVATETAWT